MSFKLFIIPAALLSLLYGFVMASIAHAEATQLWESQCQLVEDTVECDVSSDYGISNVHVFVSSGIGDITLLDQDYVGCPTEVQVSIDAAVFEDDPEMEVKTCGVPIPCDGCSAEICIPDVTCPEDGPGVGVGRPDPLPLKAPTAPSIVKPLVLSSAGIAPR